MLLMQLYACCMHGPPDLRLQYDDEENEEKGSGVCFAVLL